MNMELFRGGVGEKERALFEFRAIVQRALEVLRTKNPDRWIKGLYRTLLEERDRIQTLPDEVKEYLEDEIEETMFCLREIAEAQKGTGGDGKIGENGKVDEITALNAQKAIHDFEELFAHEENGVEREPINVSSISFEELQNEHPDTLNVSTDKEGYCVIKVRAESGGEWIDFRVPRQDALMHKGGIPRILLKMHVGANQELLNVEIPPNDIDVIALEKNESIAREAQEIGADLEGIEYAEGVPVESLMERRDIDLNQCFVTSKGLIFSQRAEEAARTGHIQIEAEDRGLHGKEYFYFDGVRLVKNRGMYRLFKFLAEGKAESFDFIPLNEQVDMGIYWLILARKISKKPNAGLLFDRLFELGRQTGQLHEGEEDMFDVLERVHAEFPFFAFDNKQQTEIEVLRWLGGKIGKMADRSFRMKNKISSEMSLERKPGDDIPYRVTLPTINKEQAGNSSVSNRWQTFLEGASRRNAANGDSKSIAAK